MGWTGQTVFFYWKKQTKQYWIEGKIKTEKLLSLIRNGLWDKNEDKNRYVGYKDTQDVVALDCVIKLIFWQQADWQTTADDQNIAIIYSLYDDDHNYKFWVDSFHAV